MKKENEKFVIFLLDKQIDSDFALKCQKNNITKSDYLRYSIKKLLGDPSANAEILSTQQSQLAGSKEIKKLKNEISRVGNNLNQYIHNMNIKMNEGVLEKEEIVDVTKAVKSTMNSLNILALDKEKEVSKNA